MQRSLFSMTKEQPADKNMVVHPTLSAAVKEVKVSPTLFKPLAKPLSYKEHLTALLTFIYRVNKEESEESLKAMGFPVPEQIRAFLTRHENESGMINLLLSGGSKTELKIELATLLKQLVEQVKNPQFCLDEMLHAFEKPLQLYFNEKLTLTMECRERQSPLDNPFASKIYLASPELRSKLSLASQKTLQDILRWHMYWTFQQAFGRSYDPQNMLATKPIVTFLLNCGFDTNCLYPVQPCCFGMRGGKPFLTVATEFADPDFAKLLIDAGADVHAIDCMGYTALQMSIARGNYECAKLLAQCGAKGAKKDWEQFDLLAKSQKPRPF